MKTIKIIHDTDSLEVKLYIDNVLVTKHMDTHLPNTIRKILMSFGVNEDDFKILEKRC